MKQREISYDTAYTWNLKKKMELIYKTENRVTDVENKAMVTRREMGARDNLGD